MKCQIMTPYQTETTLSNILLVDNINWSHKTTFLCNFFEICKITKQRRIESFVCFMPNVHMHEMRKGQNDQHLVKAIENWGFIWTAKVLSSCWSCSLFTIF
ncbi:hypothetical protein GOODEAATRI_013258 [Goodea atripinnis]|uniref:Uncharacterized protein n=1 Tax=Goodea atripinnis TaxID=208336 RepID=A0ABV0PNB6_9TELE